MYGIWEYNTNKDKSFFLITVYKVWNLELTVLHYKYRYVVKFVSN
jgi:hypothetical protein